MILFEYNIRMRQLGVNTCWICVIFNVFFTFVPVYPFYTSPTIYGICASAYSAESGSIQISVTWLSKLYSIICGHPVQNIPSVKRGYFVLYPGSPWPVICRKFRPQADNITMLYKNIAAVLYIAVCVPLTEKKQQLYIAFGCIYADSVWVLRYLNETIPSTIIPLAGDLISIS